MKKINSELIQHIGIGAFTILWIFDLSGMLKLILENLLIIVKSKPLIVNLLSEIAGVLFFILILLWVLNYFKTLKKPNLRNLLIKSMCIFFGIFLLQFLFSFLESGFLSVKFSDEFNLYYDGLKGNYAILGYLSLIPILKHLFLIIVFLVKGKIIISND